MLFATLFTLLGLVLELVTLQRMAFIVWDAFFIGANLLWMTFLRCGYRRP